MMIKSLPISATDILTQAYGNERGVGEGIRTCGIPREELFVVSKVAAEHKTYEDAKANLW